MKYGAFDLSWSETVAKHRPFVEFADEENGLIIAVNTPDNCGNFSCSDVIFKYEGERLVMIAERVFKQRLMPFLWIRAKFYSVLMRDGDVLGYDTSVTYKNGYVDIVQYDVGWFKRKSEQES